MNTFDLMREKLRFHGADNEMIEAALHLGKTYDIMYELLIMLINESNLAAREEIVHNIVYELNGYTNCQDCYGN